MGKEEECKKYVEPFWFQKKILNFMTYCTSWEEWKELCGITQGQDESELR